MMQPWSMIALNSRTRALMTVECGYIWKPQTIRGGSFSDSCVWHHSHLLHLTRIADMWALTWSYGWPMCCHQYIFTTSLVMHQRFIFHFVCFSCSSGLWLITMCVCLCMSVFSFGVFFYCLCVGRCLFPLVFHSLCSCSLLLYMYLNIKHTECSCNAMSYVNAVALASCVKTWDL